jgi:hypothetical protein
MVSDVDPGVWRPPHPRDPVDAPPPASGRVVDGRAPERTAPARHLRELAAERATGTLRVRAGDPGDPDPTEGLDLVEGVVVAARATRVPTPDAVHRARARSAARRRAPPPVEPVGAARVLRESTFDAATVLLYRDGPFSFERGGVEEGRVEEGRVEEGTAPPGGPRRGWPAARVAAEAARRTGILRALAPWITPGTRLRRAHGIPRPIRLGPAEWDFIVLLGAGGTPVDIAHEMGAGITETMVLGYRLRRLGVVLPEILSGTENAFPRAIPPFQEGWAKRPRDGPG